MHIHTHSYTTSRVELYQPTGNSLRRDLVLDSKEITPDHIDLISLLVISKLVVLIYPMSIFIDGCVDMSIKGSIEQHRLTTTSLIALLLVALRSSPPSTS